MRPEVAAIVARIRAAEAELKEDIANQARRHGFTRARATPHFPADIRRAHAKLKPSLLSFFLSARPLPLLTAPVIYSLIVPLTVLDLWMSTYQLVCFPVYGIPRVRRGDYFALDRGKLAYLNAIEKVHCMYCSYANGLIAYVREIAARTEQYWCPIKHAAPVHGPHDRYHLFSDYGDAAGYRRDLPALRRSFHVPGDEPPPGQA